MVRIGRIGLGARQGEEAETQGGGVLGGMEVLQCYNPHRTDGFCTIGVLQRCYRGATGCYAPWPEGAATPETLTTENAKNTETLTARNAKNAERPGEASEVGCSDGL